MHIYILAPKTSHKVSEVTNEPIPRKLSEKQIDGRADPNS